MYKKILVGVDESKDSIDAVKKAIEFQKTHQSEVVVFHSVVHSLSEMAPVFSPLAGGSATISYNIHEDNINLGKRILKDVEDMFSDPNLKVETRLIFDVPPEDYIKKKTIEEGFDLIILGCKGAHSKLARTFIGTIPNSVVNNATSVDVLIVR